jgi:hypothetical protein
VSPYVRTVKTASGARAVQIVHSFHRGSRDIEHIGSAQDGAELELLKAVARQRLAAGQEELDLGLSALTRVIRLLGGATVPLWPNLRACDQAKRLLFAGSARRS